MQHTLLVQMQDKPGALHRAVTLFRRRNYNVAALHVERSEVAGISRMTVDIEAPAVQQIMKELDRLVDVLTVRDVTRYPAPATTTHVAPHMQADGIGDEAEVGE